MIGICFSHYCVHFYQHHDLNQRSTNHSNFAMNKHIAIWLRYMRDMFEVLLWCTSTSSVPYWEYLMLFMLWRCYIIAFYFIIYYANKYVVFLISTVICSLFLLIPYIYILSDFICVRRYVKNLSFNLDNKYEILNFKLDNEYDYKQ